MKKVKFDVGVKPSEFDSSPTLEWEGYLLEDFDFPCGPFAVARRPARGVIGYVPGQTWAVFHTSAGIAISASFAPTRAEAIERAEERLASHAPGETKEILEKAVVRARTRWLVYEPQGH